MQSTEKETAKRSAFFCDVVLHHWAIHLTFRGWYVHEYSTLEDETNTLSQNTSHRSLSDAATHLNRAVNSTAPLQKPKNSQSAMSFKFINTQEETSTDVSFTMHYIHNSPTETNTVNLKSLTSCGIPSGAHNYCMASGTPKVPSYPEPRGISGLPCLQRS